MLAPKAHKPDPEAHRELGQTLWSQSSALLGDLGEPEAAVARAEVMPHFASFQGPFGSHVDSSLSSTSS